MGGDPQAALAQNAAPPFMPLGTDQPLPLHLDPAKPDYARALDCLASAVLYEAGDDREGQAAVAQVVLNRVRHPAFPHSVCEVVYQGSQRATGCQFTFTCDGSLRRVSTRAAWARARATASAFLAGETYPLVGMATHYHTQEVHPYWSATLEKIARVGTHLFFRWSNGWGRRPVFTAAYVGKEPIEQKLALLSLAHGNEANLASTEGEGVAGSGDLPSSTASSRLLTPGEGDHFILVDSRGNGSDLALQGLRHCRGQAFCKVVGWERRGPGSASPQNPLINAVAFLYVSDRRHGVEILLWDCTRFNRPTDTQCLSDQNETWITFQGGEARAS